MFSVNIVHILSKFTTTTASNNNIKVKHLKTVICQ